MKISNVVLAVALFLFSILIPVTSFAQNSTLPSLEDNPLGPISGQMESNTIGITCGVPESLNRTEGTRCCNTNIDSGELYTEPLKRAPTYFCIGGALAKGGGGLLSAITGVVKAPFRVIGGTIGGIGDLLQGHFSDAFSNLVTVGTLGAYPAIKDTVSAIADSEGDLCLSQAIQLMYISSLSSNPLMEMKKPPIAPQPCMEGATPTSSDYASASCKCTPAKEDQNGVGRLCGLYMQSSTDAQVCKSCAASGGYWTGAGCIKTDMAGFIGSIFGIGLGVAGTAAFLCILYAAFILQTSRGNPERIKKAQENLRACISGLLLIIFSIVILRIIGVSILQIPGLS